MEVQIERNIQLDIFKVIAIYFMLHANFIWGAPGVPEFFLHAGVNASFLGLPDFIYITFPLALGMSIPYSLAKEPFGLSIFSKILKRSMILILIGKLEVLRNQDYNHFISNDLLFLLIFLFVLLGLSLNERFKACFIFVLFLAVSLLFYLGPLGAREFILSDFGVLGNLGLNYFFVSMAYYLSKKLPNISLIITVFLLTAHVTLDYLGIYYPFVLRILFGGQLIIALLGKILSLQRSKAGFSFFVFCLFGSLSYVLYGNVYHAKAEGRILYYILASTPSFLFLSLIYLKKSWNELGSISKIGSALFAIYISHFIFVYLVRLLQIDSIVWFFSDIGGWAFVLNVSVLCALFMWGINYILIRKKYLKVRV